MYNNEALKHSNSVLEEQYKFLLTTRPYIKEIAPTDNKKNMKADYLYNIDARAFSPDNHTETVQLKNRNLGNNDFYFLARKLSGKAATEGDIGFMYNGTKYTFDPTSDIYVERINGKDITVTKNEIHSLEAILSQYEDCSSIISNITPKYLYTDNHDKFPSGHYYVFMSLDNLAKALKYIFEQSNPNLFC